MKLTKTSTALTLSTLAGLYLSQPIAPALCEQQVYSAQFVGLLAPTHGLLQAQCQALCSSARNEGSNRIPSKCVLQDVTDIQVQTAYLIRFSKCNDQCTGRALWEGDCGCAVDQANTVVELRSELLLECDAWALLVIVFDSSIGWSSRYAASGEADACPSGVPDASKSR